MEHQKKRILITGAAGYVGAMLCEHFARRSDVESIFGLDIAARPDMLAAYKNIIWEQANTVDDTWQKRAADFAPHVVVHTAWHIRDMYGNTEQQWRWNVEGSKKVFDFAFAAHVERLIHFSTAAIYGAYASNTCEHLFTEEEPMREAEYRYGIEKRAVEDALREKANGHTDVSVAVVRPAAITGPRGRFARIRFGLQSALSGQLQGNMLYRVISLMVSYVPATPWWVRQFVHEDDVADIITRLSFGPLSSTYEIFNLAPPGEPVFARHMARAVGKRVLPIMPWMVRVAYFVFWHMTRGKVPTSRGVWRFYSYPLLMNGSKVTRELGYTYQYSSQDAFYYTNGRYTGVVPQERLRNKETAPALQTA